MAIMFTNWLKNKFRPIPAAKTTTGCSGDRDCLQLLELMLDNEANDEQAKLFHEHIEKCMPCYEYFNLEKAIKEVIQTKIKRKPVPGDLVDAIKSKIKETAY